jgi:hypothetical protein
METTEMLLDGTISMIIVKTLDIFTNGDSEAHEVI